ncbi:MAG: DUF4838 domain-containing protein [Bacteroidota bacterium]
MIKKSLIAVVVLMLVYGFAQAQKLILAQNGKTNYQIKTMGDAATTDVAKIFTNYFNQSTGASITLDDQKGGLKYSILFQLVQKGSNEWNQLSDAGFIIKTSAASLNFYARTNLGLEYAVYTFFESYANCRCYAKNLLIIPKHTTFEIPQIGITQNPSFEFRVSYNNNAFFKPFNNWQKLNNYVVQENNIDFDISPDWGLWVHTLAKLVPPSEYFANHPEYYAMRSGERSPNQLCLSNPDVLKITIASLQKMIERNPNAKYWSVSQMDNFDYCQCAKCKATDTIEESHAGSIIRFVNKVAAAFPDKIISTLAYQYSRKPPKITKPASNVNIMLCTIECDRSKPIADDNTKGSFAEDMRGWAKITNNILVWDYVVNFWNALLPFPNFHVLQPNVKFFKDNHATMIFEQGFTAANTEFADLRGYMLAKLMWNVNLNADSLMNDFLRGYYGPAAPYIRRYIDIMTSELKKSGTGLTLYEPAAVYKNGYLSPQLLNSYFEILEQARKAVGNDTTLQIRVENALQPLRYAWLEIGQSEPHTPYWLFEQKPDGSFQIKKQAQTILADLIAHAKKYGPIIFHEMGTPPDEYEIKMQTYFNKGVSSSFTKVKEITYNIEYDDEYPAEGPNTIVDGVFGTLNYNSLWLGWEGENMQATIELKETQTVKEVQLNCLDDNDSWILAPLEIKISFSTDGKAFKQIGTYINPHPAEKIDPQIVHIAIPLNGGKGVVAKYIRVFCKNVGNMPKWSGVDHGESWVFIDEIEIK